MIKKIIILLFLIVPMASLAADVSVGPVQSGSANGSNWSNIIAWDNVSFTRGNTYYLQDGTYGAKTLNTATSGATYIYIKKAIESAHGSATGWSSAYGDGVATFDDVGLVVTTNYWDISGVTGGGPGSWKTGHGIAFTAPAATAINFFNISDTDHVNIRHISFVQTGNTEAGMGSDGIYASGGGSMLDNSTLEYLYFNNIGGLPFFFRNGSGNIIQYNYTDNICGRSAWDVNEHCEGLVMYSMSDLNFRWNYIAECPSSGGFVKNDTGNSTGVRIYGNVFSHGFPIQCNTGTCTNWRIFNNTFHNFTSGPIGGDGSTPGWYVVNHIQFKGNSPSRFDSYTWLSQISGTTACSSNADNTTNITVLMPDYCDVVPTGNIQTDPFVDSSSTLAEGFALTGPIVGWPGQDACVLTGECTGEIKYNIDAFGNTRGADGVWDRGAYEYVTGGTPAAPTLVGVGMICRGCKLQ